MALRNSKRDGNAREDSQQILEKISSKQILSVFHAWQNESQVDTIFRPFKRLNPIEGFSGSGIGLGATLKIFKRHRGTIIVKSTLGKGSIFIVTLPMTPLPINQSMLAVAQRLLIVDNNEVDLQII